MTAIFADMHQPFHSAQNLLGPSFTEIICLVVYHHGTKTYKLYGVTFVALAPQSLTKL